MDMGWIVTFASDQKAPVQLCVASEGGCGIPVPDLPIEVDNVEQHFDLAKSLGFEIACELTRESWGGYRFLCVIHLGSWSMCFLTQPKILVVAVLL
ncbi:MAG: hypothetical protein GY761_03640 [Hyphomicrobiales bacterium]|nr:hypothetical protein [Hyphomicrobiales bacterium]